VVAEAKPRAQPGVIEGADKVGAALAEVGPAVVVGRDDHGGRQDRGRRGRPDAVQTQRAVPELARDAGGTGVQHGRVQGRGAPSDLGDRPDGGVVPADVEGGQVRPGQDEADDLAVDEAAGVTLAVFRPVHGGDGGHRQLAAAGTWHGMAGPGGQADGRPALVSRSRQPLRVIPSCEMPGLAAALIHAVTAAAGQVRDETTIRLIGEVAAAVIAPHRQPGAAPEIAFDQTAPPGAPLVSADTRAEASG
jgi:hypothetical protein